MAIYLICIEILTGGTKWLYLSESAVEKASCKKSAPVEFIACWKTIDEGKD